ncbi:MAG: amidohydrolase family protein [Cardiobacteriaceae bacterium]|nr:amidohydrolase family protein [Cardiobacteriaceae bacterium]
MRLDAHRHYWRYLPEDYPWISDALAIFKRDFLPKDSAALDKALSIEGVIAVQARQSEVENAFLMDLAQSSNIKGIVGWVDLCADNVAERLDFYRQSALMRGFRHLVQDEPNPSEFWGREDFNCGVSALQAHGFVYDILVKQADLSAAVAFSAKQDKALLVLDHLGKPNFHDFHGWYKSMQELAKMPHVNVKISGLLLEAGKNATFETVKPYVQSALELFGVERCMLGSDDPVCLLTHNRDEVVGFWQSALAELSHSEQSALGGETAKRIYGV